MKKIIITTQLLLVFISGFSQNVNYGVGETTLISKENIYYEVHGKYKHPIQKEKLMKAKLLSDILDSYPSQWIKGYVSVEVSTTHNGKTTKANGKNATLTTEQKNILNTVELGDNVVINIKYTSENAVTKATENSTINYVATIIPKVEAEYMSGRIHLNEFLKTNAINKLPENAFSQSQQAVVRFTINEGGEIANVQIFKTSGDVKIDKLLLEAITNMPKWRPAENANGIKVKQEFEFSIGGGC